MWTIAVGFDRCHFIFWRSMNEEEGRQEARWRQRRGGRERGGREERDRGRDGEIVIFCLWWKQDFPLQIKNIQYVFILWVESIYLHIYVSWASQVVLEVKNPPANAGDIKRPRFDLLEEGMATHSSILAWRIPWAEEPGGLQSMGSQRVRHSQSNLTSTHMHMYSTQ